MERWTDLAAKRADQECVHHQALREPIAEPAAELGPCGVEERVRGDGSEIDDIDREPNLLSKP